MTSQSLQTRCAVHYLLIRNSLTRYSTKFETFSFYFQPVVIMAAPMRMNRYARAAADDWLHSKPSWLYKLVTECVLSRFSPLLCREPSRVRPLLFLEVMDMEVMDSEEPAAPLLPCVSPLRVR